MRDSDRLIRIAEPDLGPDVEDRVVRVLRSGRLAQGPEVAEFERLCAEMAGTTHAVAVSNGTVSLEASMEALGIGPGDEVVTSPLTFAATLNAILQRGATAVFADVDHTWTVSPAALAAAITPRTAALLPVHLYGQCADMPALCDLARGRALAVVEDAAQAHGAEVGGRRAGSFGVGSFSFYATKNVTAGEGGVITTSDDALADRLRILRNQGMVARYEYELIGRNLRMTELQAAVGVTQLHRLAEINERRRRNADLLREGLGDIEGLELPEVAAGRTAVWHQFTVLLPDGTDRDAVVERLRTGGIEAGIYYPRLVWDYPPYREHDRVRPSPAPVAEDVARRCLSLPVHQRLTEPDVSRVIDGLRDALRC